MKTIRLTALLMGTCLLFSGCPGASFFGKHDLDYFSFSLHLNFQDASGKDLAEGIGYTPDIEYNNYSSGLVKPELYTLDASPDILDLYYCKVASNSYLFLGRVVHESITTFTILLTCPYVFGDDTRHEIVVHCEERNSVYVCTRLTFDGEDIDITKQEYYSAFATIVLD